jgi:cytochrome P450 family 110
LNFKEYRQMTTFAPQPVKPASKQLDGLKVPALLQTLMAVFRPLEYGERARSRYGDVFTMQLIGSTPYVVVCHPQGIQEILTADPALFDSGRANIRFFQPSLGDNSLILLDGERHQRQRKLLMPSFHGERMKAYGQLICDITEQAIARWIPGQPFVMRASMQDISLRVILRTVFGLDEGERYQQLRQLLSSWLDINASAFGSAMSFIPFLQKDLGSWSPWGRFLRRKQQIDDLIYAEIRDRRQQPLGEDILSLMMAARDENGEGMTDVELRDELMTLLIAGHETTATALAWAFYWIHRTPGVYDKLKAELDALPPDADALAIAKLPYLNAVCCETLRIYPVALFTFARIPKVPFEVMGYPIKPGTMLLPAIYLTHHREDLYPEPKQFKPERFIERKFSAYEYLPFGGGNRMCIGYAFAQFEMKLVLATVLSQVKLALVDKRPVRPVRRGLTVSPAGGVGMVVTGARS